MTTESKQDALHPINEYSLLRNEKECNQAATRAGFFRKLDYYDKISSQVIHTMSIPLVEVPILILGHLFNRQYVFISVLLSFALSYAYSDMILDKLSPIAK